MKIKNRKIVPRLKIENESEKEYKTYLRNFFYDLNPPHPDTRYQFAYNNGLKDSAEFMDGPEGLYTRYLEEFYNDYYAVLENQVNQAFYMPQQVKSHDKKGKFDLKVKFENIKDNITEKKLARREAKLAKKESNHKEKFSLKSIFNNFKEKKLAKREIEEDWFDFVSNSVKDVENDFEFDLESTTKASSMTNLDLNPNIQLGLYSLKKEQIIDRIYRVDNKNNINNSLTFDLQPLKIEDKREKVKLIEMKKK